jgi:hypothetical protein
MDFKLIETQNGGDFVKLPNDLSVVLGFENMPYLGMFGGNVAASTPSKRLNNEQAFDWWGNSLLMPNDLSLQFNSLTERALNQTLTTSAGRIIVERAVIKDLEFMKPFAEVTVSVTFPKYDHVKISIRVKEKSNNNQKEYIYIWDRTKGELSNSDSGNEPNGSPIINTGFNYLLDFRIG